MKRVFAVIEIADQSPFDPEDDADLDGLAEDLLCIAPNVRSAVVYRSLADLQADEAEAKRPTTRIELRALP